jgi:hypothetical protein
MRRQTWQQWVRACGADPNGPADICRGALAPLTGQDTRALSAVAACWELYSNSDDAGQRGALFAVVALLPAIQEKNRYLARELIAFALDWSDRDRVWDRLDAARRGLLRVVDQ